MSIAIAPLDVRSRPVAARNSAKRAIDVAVAVLALIVFAPLMLLTALAVWASGPGPVIFRQTRIGLDGREFSILKFRSMRPDAEARLRELASRNEREGPVFKVRRDPRCTTVGRVIRRCSIDELPQLINVLAGDMSLVGPRPPLPHEVARYDHIAKRRLAVRPGITGAPQVAGRGDLPFGQALALDLDYIDGWTIGIDARILARTVTAVLTCRGAY